MSDCKSGEYKELIKKLVEWFESDEVQKTFEMAATNSLIRPHMAIQVSEDFGRNAGDIWKKAKDIAHN